ncbi:MAG: hypothetical protein H6589_04430 [Flavobacteriales bacterium]|nr:hypothetical protein [Flavobacteriales bacterium]
MKKLIKILFVALSIFTYSTSIAQETECDASALKADLKPFLMPVYKYDSSNITKFTYKAEKQGKEIEVPLFSSEKYRLLFNASTLPDVEIYIYDKPMGKPNRTLLYASKSKNNKEGLYSYDPEKSAPVYVTYILPGSENVGANGCVVFLLGYKF